MKKWWIIRKK